MEGLAIEGTGWGSGYQPRLSAKKCWLEADGMQKVELGGESSGTPIKIGNKGMQTTCRGYLEIKFTVASTPEPKLYRPWSKLYVRNRDSKTFDRGDFSTIVEAVRTKGEISPRGGHAKKFVVSKENSQ